MNCIWKYLGILKKKTKKTKQNKWKAIVLGLDQNSLFSKNQTLLVLLDLCVKWWSCEKFVFCLSSLLSVFLYGCEKLHWKYILDFSEFLYVVRGFLNQSDCRIFKNSILLKQAILNMYLDIIMWLEILRACKLIKCFSLAMSRHTQLCLNQSDSKILEISATQEKF